jgi:hypothetical protein
MTNVIRGAVGVVGTAAAGVRILSRVIGTGGAARAQHRWLGVTVLRRPDEVAPDGQPPEPLRRLGDAIEVDIRLAPGDKGSELYARLRSMPQAGPVQRLSGDDPRRQVRTALREAKSLLEAGEVMRPDAPRTTHPGPAGRLLQVVDRIAQGEGRL